MSGNDWTAPPRANHMVILGDQTLYTESDDQPTWATGMRAAHERWLDRAFKEGVDSRLKAYRLEMARSFPPDRWPPLQAPSQSGIKNAKR